MAVGEVVRMGGVGDLAKHVARICVGMNEEGERSEEDFEVGYGGGA